MADQFTEVTSQGWFSRLGGAFKGILVGLIFFAGAFMLLFWNEGRAVKRHKALVEGRGAVVSVSADQVDTGNEGKLVHVTGLATTEEILADFDFAVSENALRLRRTVEIYQWQEHSQSETKQKLGGGTETVTTYSYDRAWSEGLVDSGSFEHPEGHENLTTRPYASTEQIAQSATLGGYRLPPSTVGRIDRWQDLAVGGAAPAELPDGAEPWNDGYFIGLAPGAPEVGDMRVVFAVVRPLEVSLVAKQAGRSFAPYRTSNDGTIDLLQVGVHGAEAMFQTAKEANKTLAWLLRALGFLVMFLGLKMVLAPLKVLADVVPLFGRIVGAGTGAIAFLVAAILGVLTIAVAWLFYRPFLGIGLLLVVGALTFVAVKKITAAGAAG